MSRSADSSTLRCVYELSFTISPDAIRVLLDTPQASDSTLTLLRQRVLIRELHEVHVENRARINTTRAVY